MRVRQAQSTDVEEIVRQYVELAGEGFIGAEPPIDVEARSERFRQLIEADNADAMFILEDDNHTAIGHGGVHTTRVDGVLTFGMAVLPDARGRGGGRLLLDTLVEYARGTGAHKLELEAWVDNPRAVALYASGGFEVEGIRRNHYRRRDGSLRSSMVMALLFG